MIRVLVCEDSIPVSQLLVELIQKDGRFQVIGVVGNGQEAIEFNRKYRPDIITMDVRMPGINGLEATRRIMSQYPTPIVLVSELAEFDVALSIEALNAGALAVLPKPNGPGHVGAKIESENLRQTLATMSSVKVIRHWLNQPSALNSAVKPQSRKKTTDPFQPFFQPKMIVIGSSTGGPTALATLLKGLPRSFKLPILITQHIMPGFSNGLANWLTTTTGRQVLLAKEHMKIEPESSLTLLAPDDSHLVLSSSQQLYFEHSGPVNNALPSVDVMFNSVAEVMGGAVIGVILTGMGRDGAAGLSRLRQKGAYTIAQDETTSVIFGMPKEAIAAGAVCKILPLERIAAQIVEVCGPDCVKKPFKIGD